MLYTDIAAPHKRKKTKHISPYIIKISPVILKLLFAVIVTKRKNSIWLQNLFILYKTYLTILTHHSNAFVLSVTQ